MKLYKQNSEIYSNGSKKEVYKFENLQNNNDIKNFLKLLQEQFGIIYDINVKKYKSESEILLYDHYDNLNEFIARYNNPNMKDYNVYEFLGQNIHYRINTDNNTIEIYFKKKRIKDEIQPDYEYYKFANGLIIRIDKNTAHCFYLTTSGQWKNDDAYLKFVEDAAYKYEIIDDPLEEKKKTR